MKNNYKLQLIVIAISINLSVIYFHFKASMDKTSFKSWATPPAEDGHVIRSKAPDQLLSGPCGEIVLNQLIALTNQHSKNVKISNSL